MPSPLRILFFYKNIGKYALNALAGALQSHCPDLDIAFAKNEQQLLLQLQQTEFDAPCLVLWTFYSAQFADSLASLHRIKQQTANHSAIFHLAGGVHCSAMPESVLRGGFDYVACGEGEELLLQFVQALRHNDFYPAIRGLCYLDNEANFIYQGRAIIENLDPYPPGSSRYRKFGPIEITRGCVYACKFCQTPYVNKARFRHRSVENSVEFAKIMYQHGLRDFRFITPTSLSYGSDNHEVNLAAIEHLLRSMRQSLGDDAKLFFGSFPSEVRPEHVSDQALRLLKRYVDNDNLIIGAQSGSDAILDSCGRGHDVAQVRHATRLCLRHGFRPNIDFLFGLPGESERDRQLSLNLAEQLSDLGAKIHLHSFMPLPGTPYANTQAERLEQSTIDRINKLCSHGKAYGQWQAQASRSTSRVSE